MHFQTHDPTSDYQPYSCNQLPIKPPLKYHDLLFVTRCSKSLVKRQLPCDSLSTDAASKPQRSQAACSVFPHTRIWGIYTQDFVWENNCLAVMHSCPLNSRSKKFKASKYKKDKMSHPGQPGCSPSDLLGSKAHFHWPPRPAWSSAATKRMWIHTLPWLFHNHFTLNLQCCLWYR